MAEEADRSRDTLEWVYEYFLGGSGQTVSQLVEYSIMNDLENRTLAQTRNILLPKLMSGEICLADAKKEVEAVA